VSDINLKMLIKKSEYTYKIKFTSTNYNPVIFCLKSGVEVNDTAGLYYNYQSIYVPRQPYCTVTLRNLSLSNFIELNKLVNSVISRAIQGRGYGLDYKINMEVKKGNQIIHVYNVLPNFDTSISSWSPIQPGQHMSVTLKGDYAEYIYT
jgi:hypothetical protein